MTVISNTYNNKQLALINSDTAQSEAWLKHPVRFTKIEAGTLQLDVAMPLLEGKDLSPATLAGIKVEQIASPLLESIVQNYQESISNYKSRLKEATTKDAVSIKYNEVNHRVKEDYWIFWIFWAIAGTSFISREQYNTDAQAYRQMWFSEVSIFENIRLNNAKNLIENAIPQLVEQLEEIAGSPTVNMDLCMKAWQLQKVYATLFPENALPQREALVRLLPADSEMNRELQLYKKRDI